MWKKIQEWLFNEEIEEYDLDEQEEEKPSLEKEALSILSKQRKDEELKSSDKTLVISNVPKINIDIQADDTQVSTVEEKREPRKKLVRKEEYEMPPVISPYFGVKGENGDSDSISRKLPPIKKRESFNEVISPFYGNEKNEKKKTVAEEKETLSFDFMNQRNDFEISDEEEENVSLDQIISSTVEDENDMIQFSLFGESKKLSDEEFKNENIDDDNSELPF